MIRRNSATLDYVFVDEWRLAVGPERVVAVVRAVQDWPTWWPSVRSVQPVPADPGAGPTWRFTFATRLPYRMVFDAEVVQDDPVAGTRTRVTGQVEGTGSWRIDGIDGDTQVRFDWRVRPRARWMRVLSPLARPVFAWNHAALMSEGGQALADRLQTTLLAPVVSELSRPADPPAPAAPSRP